MASVTPSSWPFWFPLACHRSQASSLLTRNLRLSRPWLTGEVRDGRSPVPQGPVPPLHLAGGSPGRSPVRVRHPRLDSGGREAPMGRPPPARAVYNGDGSLAGPSAVCHPEKPRGPVLGLSPRPPFRTGPGAGHTAAPGLGWGRGLCLCAPRGAHAHACGGTGLAGIAPRARLGDALRRPAAPWSPRVVVSLRSGYWQVPVLRVQDRKAGGRQV